MEVAHFKSQKERMDYLKGRFEEIVPIEAKEEPKKAEKIEEKVEEKPKKAKKSTKKAKKEVKDGEVQAE